jgi:hypothetical protein
MNDEQLVAVWQTLDPTAAQRGRIDTRVSGWLEAHDTSLAAEWLALLRMAPLGTLALAAASAVAIVGLSPLLWVVRVVAGALT